VRLALPYHTFAPSKDLGDAELLTTSSIPLNCSFEVDDFEDAWLYAQKFDLIHGRLINSGVRKPQHIFAEAFSALTPGGYLEMQDIGCPAADVDGSLSGTNRMSTSILPSVSLFNPARRISENSIPRLIL
jgi:hypothetical protein